MNFKNFQVFGFRRAAERRATGSDVGTIVFLMLALVFAPIAIANLAVAMTEQSQAGHAPAFAAIKLFGAQDNLHN